MRMDSWRDRRGRGIGNSELEILNPDQQFNHGIDDDQKLLSFEIGTGNTEYCCGKKKKNSVCK